MRCYCVVCSRIQKVQITGTWNYCWIKRSIVIFISRNFVKNWKITLIRSQFLARCLSRFRLFAETATHFAQWNKLSKESSKESVNDLQRKEIILDNYLKKCICNQYTVNVLQVDLFKRCSYVYALLSVVCSIFTLVIFLTYDSYNDRFIWSSRTVLKPLKWLSRSEKKGTCVCSQLL